MQEILKVLIADDHPLILEAIANNLKSIQNIDIVAMASNGLEAKSYIDNNKIDIAIFDVNMPFMNGIELSKYICTKHNYIKMIAVTMQTDIVTLKKLTNNGVRCIVDKNSNDIEIAIKSTIENKDFFSKNVRESLFHNCLKICEPKNIQEPTKTEMEILPLIAEGLSNEEIAVKLFKSVSTINSHCNNMFFKYKANNRTHLVKIVSDLNFI